MAPPDRAKALGQLRRVCSEIAEGIDLCLSHDVRTPALILLYSGIDICGWMAAADPRATVQDSFTTWVDEYMNPESTLGCSALELYGARCGLVHTFTPESTLYDKGKVRKVIYAWSPSRVETLREMINLAQLSKQYAAAQGDDLVETYRRGIHKFLEHLNGLPTARLKFIAVKVFGLMSAKEGEAVVAWGKRLRR